VKVSTWMSGFVSVYAAVVEPYEWATMLFEYESSPRDAFSPRSAFASFSLPSLAYFVPRTPKSSCPWMTGCGGVE